MSETQNLRFKDHMGNEKEILFDYTKKATAAKIDWHNENIWTKPSLWDKTLPGKKYSLKKWKNCSKSIILF